MALGSRVIFRVPNSGVLLRKDWLSLVGLSGFNTGFLGCFLNLGLVVGVLEQIIRPPSFTNLD